MAAHAASERDPHHHTQKMKQRLQETMDHLRRDIDKVDDPQLKAMFETAAEVLWRLEEGVQRLRTAKRKGLARITGLELRMLLAAAPVRSSLHWHQVLWSALAACSCPLT